MLCFDRIDVSGRIDFNKSNKSRKCIICNYYYFLKVNFRFQSRVCDGCHDLLQTFISFDDVSIVSVKGNYYRIYFWDMNKDEAINRMNNIDL